MFFVTFGNVLFINQLFIFLYVPQGTSINISMCKQFYNLRQKKPIKCCMNLTSHICTSNHHMYLFVPLTDRQTDCHASGDLQAVGRVQVQTGDLLWRFSIYPQKLDDQLRLVARRDPDHSVLHPEMNINVRIEPCMAFLQCSITE